MEGVTKRIQSYVFLWERKLLDRFRQLRRGRSGDFFVLVHFAKDRITLHVTNRPEKIADNNGKDNSKDRLTENT